MDLVLKAFREIRDEKVTRVREDHKAFKEFLVQKVKRVRKETLMVKALQVQRVTLESLDLLVLVEGQVVQDQMVSLVLQETPDSQVLDMQGHEVQKVSQVYLEPKAFQGLQVHPVQVFQVLKGHLGRGGIKDFLVCQEFRDGRALQVNLRNAVSGILVRLVGRGSRARQVTQVTPEVLVAPEDLVLWAQRA